MKKSIKLFYTLLIVSLLVACNSKNNDDKGNQIKASPYAKAELKIKETKLSINYSSPRCKDREIWGNLVPYDEVWRTGADEATVFESSAKVLIEGKELAAGKYAFFTIPGKEEWTVIFNNVHNQWGAFNYDESKDALRVKVKPVKMEEHEENMTFYLLETDETSGEIKLVWDKVMVPISVQAIEPAA